jgi:hypothetical protein
MIEGNVFQNRNLRLLRLITLLGDSFASLRRRAASDRPFSVSLTPLICLAECRTTMSHAAKRASNAQSKSRRITDWGVYIDWGIYIGWSRSGYGPITGVFFVSLAPKESR